jgi:hypothetical protein
MIFIAEIGQIPETNAGSVLRYLLRMNNNPEESKGMTLSYNAESNNAAIGYQFPLRFMNIDKFEEFFRMFLDEVDRWKQKMVLYTQGTLPKDEDASGGGNAGGTASSSDLTFQGKMPEFIIGA